MRIHDPLILVYGILLSLATAVFLLWVRHIYRRQSERFADKGILTRLTAPDIVMRRRWKHLVDVLAVALMAIAIAGPQWGLSWQQKTAEGIDILLAIDLSKSMLARDIRPDRLSYVKDRIKSFVEGLSGDRVGLIGFSGDAFTLCPLTADYSGFFLALDSANPGAMARGGTSIQAAIEEAVRALSYSLTGDKVLILISDGEETAGDGAKAAAEAKKAGIEIETIGVGTPKGSPIVYSDEKGSPVTIKDRSGNVVTSKLDEPMLEAIAKATGGIYVRAGQDELGLKEIYEKRLSKLKRRQAEESLVRSYKDRYQYPLAVALVLVFISTLIGMTGGYGKD